MEDSIPLTPELVELLGNPRVVSVTAASSTEYYPDGYMVTYTDDYGAMRQFRHGTIGLCCAKLKWSLGEWPKPSSRTSTEHVAFGVGAGSSVENVLGDHAVNGDVGLGGDVVGDRNLDLGDQVG